MNQPKTKPITSPKIDTPTELIRVIEFLHETNATFEICGINPKNRKHPLWGGVYAGGKKPIVAGWFDSFEKAAEIASSLDDQVQPDGVYITLNPCNPALTARANNNLKAGVPRTQDADILRLRNFLIDADPKRPAGISSSEEEKKKAAGVYRAVGKFLRDQGWSYPLIGDSGNGWHLIYRIDLENSAENVEILKNALKFLSDKFGTADVEIDTKVFNPSRLVKLYGTTTRKGDSTPDRPHRASNIFHIPDPVEIIPIELIEKLAAEMKKTQPTNEGDIPSGSYSRLDVEGYLEKYGRRVVKTKKHGTSTLYVLPECVFNPEEHTSGESAIGQTSEGKLFYQCFHNSCEGNTWQDARKVISGDAPISNRHSSERKTKEQKGDWPDPQPLVERVEPLPYPTDALPDTIRDAVDEVQGFVQAPLPMVAVSLLSAISIAAQALINVERALRLSGPVSLFTLSIADSGERKSTIDEFATESVRELEKEQAELSKRALQSHAADHAAWKSKKDGKLSAIKRATKDGRPTDDLERELHELSQAEPEPPRIPRLLLNDETPESLAWNLAKGWPSAAVISSEAGVVFGSHGMGRDSIIRNLGLLNVLWDGGQLNVGRRTTESFLLHGARLSVCLQVQEPTLRAFFDRSEGLARGTGFLARFLITWPESTMGYRAFTEAPEHWPALKRFHSRLMELLNITAPIDEEGALQPAVITLSEDAKAAWVAFHDSIETELRDEGELYEIRDVAAKAADNTARIAGLFHVYENGPSGEIGVYSIESAARIVAWHLNESRRFFGEIVAPAEVTNAEKLEKWMMAYCTNEKVTEVSTRDVLQYGPRSVRKRGVLESAVAELEDLGRVRLAKEGRKKTIQINPALLEGGEK